MPHPIDDECLSRSVLVFRKRIIAYSETFIPSQARSLPSWTPILVGIDHNRSGTALLSGLNTCILNAGGLFNSVRSIALKRLKVMPGDWRRRLESYRPLLIHAHFGPDGLAAIPIARSLGIPLITTFHGFDITKHSPVNQYIRRRPAVFSACNKVIAVSQFIADQLVIHGCPREKIIIHHIGIDPRQFSVPDGQTRRTGLLFIGRLVQKKGCEDLLRALTMMDPDLLKEHPLQIVGEGEQLPSLKRIAHELGDCVRFLGRKRQDEIADLMAKSALLVVPSKTGHNGDSEGLPISLLEAMSMRLPIVATLHSGIPEAITHEHNGLLVPENDPEQLASAITRLLKNQELAQRLGDQARETVLMHFDVAKQGQLLETIYTDTLGACKV